MRTFTSYVSEYDAHVGKTPMGNLSREQQDEIVHLIFEPEGDYRSYLMQHDVEHYAPDGLWTLVVAAGMYLERHRVIKDFMDRAPADRDWIINFFAPTNLWLRLEEAFPPFDHYHRKTDYDWSENEAFSANDAIVDLDGDDVRAELMEFLHCPAPPSDGMLFRIPYQTYQGEWKAGRLNSFVDRGMAVQAYGLSSSAWTWILPPIFLLGLVAFIPVMIFWSVWIGLGLLVAAIASRKMLTKKAVDWVRQDALASRERYRWYSARNIVWARRV
jgi:hypothetical protein